MANKHQRTDEELIDWAHPVHPGRGLLAKVDKLIDKFRRGDRRRGRAGRACGAALLPRRYRADRPGEGGRADHALLQLLPAVG
ncbi:MAG: hypothetical protein U0797_29225 [Gemmataceae bacterium]